MHPHNPTGDLTLFELERHRLAAEIARPRRLSHRQPPAARLWARVVRLVHRDA